MKLYKATKYLTLSLFSPCHNNNNNKNKKKNPHQTLTGFDTKDQVLLLLLLLLLFFVVVIVIVIVVADPRNLTSLVEIGSGTAYILLKLSPPPQC